MTTPTARPYQVRADQMLLGDVYVGMALTTEETPFAVAVVVKLELIGDDVDVTGLQGDNRPLYFSTTRSNLVSVVRMERT